MREEKFGLDIGSNNIRISSLNLGKFISEKNVIAIRDDKFVIGYGDNAYDMFEKAPSNVTVTFPVKDSVISDCEKMQAILEFLFKKLNGGKIVKNGHFLISVPSDITEVEKRAFHELVADSKLRAKSIFMVDRSSADSVGCGIDIQSAKGNFLVNMGADTTDISVMSLGSLVLSKSVKIAGQKIDEAIVSAVKQSEGKLIGLKMAEQLKIKLTDLTAMPESKEETIFARVMSTGLPVRTTIRSEIINPAVINTLKPLIDIIKNALEKTPPELAADIIENGIYLQGGTANIKGIGNLLAKETGLRVKLIKDPANSTIRGVTTIFSRPRYDSIKFIPKEKEYN